MRKILLTLAEDTTETHCGGCPGAGPYEIDEMLAGYWCSHFYQQLAQTGHNMDRNITRLHECLAAESAADRLVEIAPEDAAIWSSPVEDLRFVDGSEVDAAVRINQALREHAKKAKVQP